MNERQQLKLLETSKTPRSILISKEGYSKIYPSRYPRVLHIVFRSKTKTVWVDEPIAKYLVKNYSDIHYYVDPATVTPPAPPEEKSPEPPKDNTPIPPEKKEPEKKVKKTVPKKKVAKNDKVTGTTRTTGKGRRSDSRLQHL